ncbi:uncharacterized protein LOC133502461 [Syngnathoides biaculeatus]|uniref:uncharacterized protein LOC133502461 n=1 Tax=Syngnathoides biaculeatus TaxID=300417 RepID=UPI002ADDE472|nr:uncharacterized protein LOC133502461 [Syngnathoides biaculeatus]
MIFLLLSFDYCTYFHVPLPPIFSVGPRNNVTRNSTPSVKSELVECHLTGRGVAITFPVRTLRPGAIMELEGQARQTRACRLLVPGLDVDEDESEVVISIRPKSSPLPRRRNSVSDEDSESELPPCSSRRVSFADAKGLSLVQVKEFDLWDVPKPPGMESLEGDGLPKEDYSLSPLTFQSPLSPEDLLVRVQEQKIELESLELIPGTTTLKGLIRVLNMSFHKAVYVRTTLDRWASHFDLLTEYVPASGDAHTDRFSFKLTLVPPFQEDGSRVDFCLRYETPLGTFWANNNNKNYVLLCHQSMKDQKENLQNQNTQKKSCLKTASQNFAEEANETPSQGADVLTNGEKDDKEQATPPPDHSHDGDNLEAEYRRSCSRRKAARMARVRDYFSQRDGGKEDDGSDTPRSEDREEIPVGERAGGQSLAEEKWKREGPRDSFEKTFSETPAQQDETWARVEPQTLEDISVGSLIGGDASTDMSVDEPPPTQHCNTFVSEAECTSESSNRFNFEIVVAPLDRQILGENEDWTCPEQTLGENCSTAREVQENLVRNNNDIPTLSSFQNLVSEDRDHQASLEYPDWCDTGDVLMDSINTTQNHEQLQEMDLPSQLSDTIQNLVSDDVEQRIGLECGGWSGPENSVAQSVENTQNHEQTSENVITNSNEQCVHASLDVLHREEHISKSEGSETIQSHTDAVVSDSVDDSASLQQTDWPDTEDAVIKPAENSQNPKRLQKILIKNSMEECLDISLDVPLPEDGAWNDAGVPIESKLSDKTDTKLTERHTNRDLLSGGSHRLSLEPDSIQVPINRSAGSTKNDVPQSQSEPVSNAVDHQASLDHADKSNREDCVAESSISTSGDLTHPEVSSYTGTERPETEVSVRSPRTFLGTQKETCCIGTVQRLGEEDLVTNLIMCKDHSQEDQEPFSNAEIDVVRNWETMVEEEEVNISGEEIQNSPGEEKPDDLMEEIQEVTSPEMGELENVFLHQTQTKGLEKEHVERISEDRDAEKHFVETQEVKMGVEMWEDKVTDKGRGDAELKDQERDVDPGNKADDISVDEAEGKDDVRWSDFDRNKLEDASLSHLCEGDESLGEASEQNPDPAVVRDEDKTVTHEDADDRLRVFTEEPESDDASAESDSDDEVELYMRCLRAVHTKDQSIEAGFSLSKRRPSLSRSKPLPSLMPPISESADEEHGGSVRDGREDARADDAARSQPSGPKNSGGYVAKWKETCSCSCMSKTLLYATLLAVFVVTAYYYDFLACFGLYLLSVVWLLCQGEKQPIRDNSIG